MPVMQPSDTEREENLPAVWRNLWRPPHAALDAFAAVMSGHWRKARDRTLQLFGPARGNWLKSLEERGPKPHHLTRGGKLIK
jgi:hypothetical protein